MHRFGTSDLLARRTFLASTLAGGVAGLCATSTAQAETSGKPDLPIVDTHQHLWDLSRFKLPWLNGEGAKSLNRNYLPADYAAATEGLGITKSVYMEVDVDESQLGQEADYVLELIQSRSSTMVAAVISGRIQDPEFPAYFKKYAQQPAIKGIRRVLHGASTPPGFCQQAQIIKNLQYLGEVGKSFDLCLRAGEIVDAVPVVDACPRTRFIVDHCGNLPVGNTDRKMYDNWKRGMAELGQRERVVCKISGIVASAKRGAWKADDLAPTILSCVEFFGHDRVMFGGDWPVCTLGASYKEWVQALKSIVNGWSPENQRKLFHDNAARFYGLT